MNKVALVTGSAKGIGREICIQLAKNGYDIIAHYNKSENKANELKNEILKIGTNCITIKADLTNKTDIDNMFLFISQTYKKIDVLINNAGISLEKMLIDCSYEDICNVISTNLTSMIYVTKLTVNNMLKYNEGKIVNISSIWGECGASCESIYSASKGGMIAFTKAMAKELAYQNITVNCICPGAIETDMMKNFSEEDRKAIIEEIPLQKIGTPKDVADAVLYLINSNYITGATISVNGGLLI